MALMGLLGYALIHYAPSVEDVPSVAALRIAMAVDILSSLAVIGVSFFSPANALYAYLLNFLSRPLARPASGPRGDD